MAGSKVPTSATIDHGTHYSGGSSDLVVAYRVLLTAGVGCGNEFCVAAVLAEAPWLVPLRHSI